MIRLRRKEENFLVSDDIVQSDGPPAPPPPEAVDWFLIIAGKQVGPMSEAEVEEGATQTSAFLCQPIMGISRPSCCPLPSILQDDC